MKLIHYMLVAAMAVPATLGAQTVVVNKTATPDATTFNTITDALSALAVDAQEPDIIQITDSAVYDEIFDITSPVEIVGTQSERPVLEVLSNSGGTQGNGGIVINLSESLTTGAVKLKNLVVLPGSGVAPNARLRSAIENRNNNLYLELENVLITANNGNDQPLITDAVGSEILKLVPTSGETYDENVIPFGAHGIILGRTSIDGNAQYEGEGVELVFKDSIITHLRNDYHPASTEPERFPTCIVVHSPYPDMNNPDPSLRRITRILGESGISFSRVGLSIVGDLEMKSDGEKIQMIGHANQAIRLDGPAANFRNISNLNFSNNGAVGILDRGFGAVRFNMTDCTSIYTLNNILLVEGSGGPANGLITIEDSTLVGGRHHASAGKFHTIRLNPDTEADVLFRNTILGGKMNHSAPPVLPPNPTPGQQTAYDNLVALRGFNVISFAGNNTLTLEGTAVIAEGPYAFRTDANGAPLAFSRGVNASLVGTPATYADPFFQNVEPSQSLSSNFLDVYNNVYADISTAAGPLGGGADFIGGISNVADWALY